ASFQKPLASKVALTSHMLKVAKLFQEPEQSLILSFGKLNADDVADKSLSRTTVQPITQPKAPTDLKSQKNRIPPSSKPKYSYESLEASKSAEEQVNHPKTAEAKKESGLDSMVDVTFDKIIDEYDQKNKATKEEPESPYDTESEIKIIKRFQPTQPADDDAQITFLGSEPYHMEIDQTLKKVNSDEIDFGLQSMPNDELASLSGFEAEDSDDEGS
nr:hypothetical protein [Tanacetum cinerariifolium]